MLWLFLAFIVLPVIEIWLITQVAGQVGWPWAIVAVIGVSVAGAWLVKREGLGVIRRVRTRLEEGSLPGKELADGAMIFFAAALMLTPGFLTDAVGLALLIPPIRAILRPPVVAFFPAPARRPDRRPRGRVRRWRVRTRRVRTRWVRWAVTTAGRRGRRRRPPDRRVGTGRRRAEPAAARADLTPGHADRPVPRHPRHRQMWNGLPHPPESRHRRAGRGPRVTRRQATVDLTPRHPNIDRVWNGSSTSARIEATDELAAGPE